MVGPPGGDGPQGLPGTTQTELLTLHARSSTVPPCPTGTRRLWQGYSVSTISTQTINQDKTGSCLKLFSPNSLFSWIGLSTPNQQSKQSYGESDVSRCSVCEVPGAVVTIHSQTLSLPECPQSWSSLWSGYSFLSVQTVSSVVYLYAMYVYRVVIKRRYNST